ncbi:hypothetical protein GNI_068660 [Gregarina niphandrodes]|uniref:Uncharacterized protein n=1 Tax=Gregarina niphandrodes TaxID=110365 RepID=A0A023B7N1_GRENI|nr:hypothetical protein GNI_068660 [Gregarina niphandrodes]EZG67456.1 hypothetical protein GNI_068660 [Gregarina niphandrodes]|eukprot:XP_011130233.1 hypothetical protein GNI_068660 [Gregarina niphandrodes]
MEGSRIYTPTLSQQIYLEAAMSRERAVLAQEMIDGVKKSPSYRIYRSRCPRGHRFEVKTPRNIMVDSMDVGMDLKVVESWQRTVEAKSRGICLLNMVNAHSM